MILLKLEKLIADDNDNKNLSKIAKKIGMSKQSLHLILSGKSKNPRRQTLEPIAKYFGCTVDDFIGVKENYSISNEIRKIMTLLNFNEYQFAEKVNLSRATIRTILENPNILPRDNTLEQICQFLGLSLDEMKGIRSIDYEKLKKKFSLKIPLIEYCHLPYFNNALKEKNQLETINSVYTNENQFAIVIRSNIPFNDKQVNITIYLTTNIIKNKTVLLYDKNSQKLISGIFFVKNNIKIFQPENMMLNSFSINNDYEILGNVLGTSFN